MAVYRLALTGYRPVAVAKRPLSAKLLRRREPSRFSSYVAWKNA